MGHSMLAPPTLDKNVFYFRVNVLSVVGVFGVAGRCIDEPYGAIVIVDDITYAAAACHLIFPLLKVTAVVSMRCEIAA
jgi:hypothetical protein